VLKRSKHDVTAALEIWDGYGSFTIYRSPESGWSYNCRRVIKKHELPPAIGKALDEIMAECGVPAIRVVGEYDKKLGKWVCDRIEEFDAR